MVAPYDVERATVDGNDVLAVWDAFAGYLASARTGGGPFLLECLTVRLGGHYEGDAAKYREADRGCRNGRPGIRSSACSATE